MTSPEPSFAVCQFAVVPVRRFADMVSEMTTQVRFGEGVEVLEENRGMWRIRMCQDGYEGWVDSRQFTSLQPQPAVAAKDLTAELTGWARNESNTGRRLLPAGTPLPEFSDGWFSLGPERWCWEGAVHRIPTHPDWQALLTESENYLNTPYFWGGRTLWGIDCSGLVQTLLAHQGLRLRRDCIEQVDEGQAVRRLSEAGPGDLAFFDGTRDGGRHVGLVLEGGRVLHASGFVRIDDLNERGIFVRETGHQSHRLTALRRVVDWKHSGT